MLAAGQVKACIQDARVWLVRQTAVSFVCFVSLHAGLFAIRSQACSGMSTARLIIGLAVISWIMMSDILPIAISRLYPLQNELKTIIQVIVELTSTLFLSALLLVLSLSLSGRPSLILMLVLVGIVIWQVGTIVFHIWLLRIRRQNRRSLADSIVDSIDGRRVLAAAPMEHFLDTGSVGLQASPLMFMPDIREMRLHEARRRESLGKVW
jgi:hypothetical protein